MVKKLVATCLGLLLILPAVIACSIANASATTLVPASANIVVQIQVGRILSNPALTIAYGELAKMKSSWPQTAEDALNQLLQKTGLDLHTVSTAVFFADIKSTDKTQNTYAGLISSGSFNESTLTAKIQQQTQQTLATSDYKGMKIYSVEQDKFEISFFDKNRLVLGTPKAVRDTIDVIKGDQKPLSGSVIDALDRVGSALITGAFVPPETLRNQITKAIPQQVQLSPKSFQDIDAIAFAADLPVLNVSFRFDAHFSNTASLQDTKDAVTGLISIAKGTSPDPNIKTAISNIQVNTSNSWLSIQGAASISDISTMISSVQTKTNK
jgi:hypothetical protein